MHIQCFLTTYSTNLICTYVYTHKLQKQYSNKKKIFFLNSKASIVNQCISYRVPTVYKKRLPVYV